MSKILSLTVEIKRDDIPNAVAPIEHITRELLEKFGIELSIISQNYSIARKELFIKFLAESMPTFQDIYDKTEYPLIIQMQDNLDSYNADGWDVMKILMSKSCISDWHLVLANAFIKSIFENIDYVSGANIEPFVG